MNELTDRARDLLRAIRVPTGWISRTELAKATGKNRISPHDVQLLERMCASGLIEMRQRKSNTPIGIAYEYRAIEGK